MMDLAFGRLTQLAFGYWNAQPLYVLAEFRVFDALAGGPRPADELATELGADPRALEGLLNAGVALGLLRKADDAYANSDQAKRFLTTASPESLIHWVRVMGRWTEPWARLGDAIRTGKPVESQALRLGEDPAYVEDFILGMHEYARRTSADLARAIDLSGGARLIDVGGGAGTYAIALAQANPALRVTLLDLKPVLPFARRIIAEHGLDGRIDVGSVDYQRDGFGSGADAILFSNVLHQESPEVCRSMLKRGIAALVPGGRVLVHGHFLDENKTGPLFSTLHNLSAYALWDGGRSYSVGDMTQLMHEAGLRGVSPVALSAGATTVLAGTRP
jgi:O-methyltransferase domain/Dimerisation domain